MKRIIIGRGDDCDIVIPDPQDNVSRHHAVVSVSYWGRMTLSDTSTNGTFINETRMLKGASVPVKRSDKIRFGSSWQFDWNTLSDPYAKVRKIHAALVVLIIVLALAVGGWYIYKGYHTIDESSQIMLKTDTTSTSTTWNSDSTKKVAPTELSTPVSKTGKNNQRSTSKRKKPSAGKIKKNSVITNKQPAEKSIKKEELRIENLSKEKNMPVIN